MLVPSSIYSDKGAGALRRLFLKKSRWSHLYAFQNERFIFVAVDHRFKVAAIQVEKGGKPDLLRTRFRLGPGDSPEPHELETDIPNENGYLLVSVSEIEEFSPHSGAILEIRTPRDLEIVKKLYANGILLGDRSPDGWNIRYTTEFHMTGDSELFPPRLKWEEKGYRPDEYGHWLLGNWQPYAGPKNILQRPTDLILSADGAAAVPLEDVEDVAVPLYQGAMVHQFDFCAAAYRRIEGKRGFKWVPIAWDDKRIEPQYLMARQDYSSAENVFLAPKLVIRDISASTNERTVITSCIPSRPCGHTLAALGRADDSGWGLATILNSWAIDFAARSRMVGSHLTLFVLEDIPVISRTGLSQLSRVLDASRSLQFCDESFAELWLGHRCDRPWKQLWVRSPHERLRNRVISEAIVLHLFGLAVEDCRSILAGCDHPISSLSSKPFTRKLDTKGFWRQEKHLDPEIRTAVLTQVAFEELQETGADLFLAQNGGQGWMLPDKLRLSDYGLGHDDRAKEYQPVASALGPRFYPWQLEQSVEESWEECERHAEILAKLQPAIER